MTFFICTVLVILVIIVIAIAARRNIENNIYICPNCKKQFKPKKKYAYFNNMGNKSQFLKCPNCKKFSICNISHANQE